MRIAIALLVVSSVPLAASAQRFQDLCEPLSGLAREQCIQWQQQQQLQQLELQTQQQQKQGQKRKAPQSGPKPDDSKK